MRGLTDTLWAETLKFRRSKAPWLSALAFLLFPLMGGLFMVILKDPEWALRAGLISTKARLAAGVADWPAYLGLLVQATSVGGFVLVGLLVIWVFGREYSERTAKDLLALPAPREATVLAKFVVVACWSLVLTALIFGIGLAVGNAIGLPGWTAALVASSARGVALGTALTICLVTPFAWAACAGRGYLPPVGGMFFVVFLSQVLATLGWGAYFPWAVPALASGVAGPSEQQLGAISYLVVLVAGLAGVTGTLAWWRWADQTV
jgi:ABC-2 type transport system permease protein